MAVIQICLSGGIDLKMLQSPLYPIVVFIAQMLKIYVS